MKNLDSNSLISVSKVSKSFLSGDATIDVLKDVSFTIPEGSFTIIHGPSGSGKTTLLNTITGLQKPTTGSVLYEQKDIYNLTPSELAHFRAKTMGIVYQQNYWVQSLTVLENVALPLYFLGYEKTAALKEALESLKRVGMDHHAAHLPTILSGGEQQRVSMARALVSNPTYIVADEPTGNLDSKNGDAIMKLLKYFNEEMGRTIILITHNLEYLPMGNQIIEVYDGVVTEAKPPSAKSGSEIVAPRKHISSAVNHATKSFMAIVDTLKPIKFKILLHMALENLKYKRSRSFLTILGVVIGIGSVYMLLSFGLGLQNLVSQDLVGADSIKIVDVSSPNSEILLLDSQHIERIQNVSHVEKISKLNNSAGEISFKAASTDSVVYGVDDAYFTMTSLDIVAGKKLDFKSAQETLVNVSLLKSLDYKDYKKAINQELSLTLKLDEGDKKIDKQFKIVGVVDSGSGASIYIPNSIYAVAGVNAYQQVKISVNDIGAIKKVRQQIEGFGFETVSPIDTIEQVNKFFSFFNIILVSFGGIGMLIAVLGMINTLTISLLERTREIGLMIALGGRHKDMRQLFIAESSLLAVLGGLLGITLAGIFSFLINALLNQVASGRGVADSFSIFSSPLWLVASILVFMFAVGYGVAYFPARRAANINPIDALRHE